MATVEIATSDHADGICRVCTASWREAYDGVLSEEYVEANVRVRYRPERVADLTRESDATAGYLVALRDANRGERGDASETVVGTVRDDRPEPGVGEVSDLYVHPNWQGEGVGSRLLAALTERQRERGATEQRVYVFADHDDAVGFYESKGFEPDGRFSAAAVDGVDSDREVLGLVREI